MTRISCHEGPGTVIIMAWGDDPAVLAEHVRRRGGSFHYTGNSDKAASVVVTVSGAHIEVIGEGGRLAPLVEEIASRLDSLSDQLHAQYA